jgi:lipopolysaccharide export system permease protein
MARVNAFLPFSTLDRYVLRKFLVTFLFMLILMTIIIVVIDVAEKIDDFIEKKPTIHQIVFDYYFHFIPFLLNLLSPICVFLTVIYFTSRMTLRMETVAIFSSGISFYRFLLPYLFLSVVLACVSFYLHAFVVPVATARWVDFEYRFVKNRRLWDKRHIHKKIDANLFLYLYSYNQYDNIGYGVTLERFEGNQLKQKLFSPRMVWLDSVKRWRMEAVKVRTFYPDREEMAFYPFLDTSLKVYPSDIYQRENFAKSLPLSQLYDYIELEKKRGSDFLKELILEKYERYAYPFAMIILTLIGAAVSTVRRREGIGFQIGLGLILTFFYILAINLSRILFSETFVPWLAIWMPNLLFFLIAIILVLRTPK